MQISKISLKSLQSKLISNFKEGKMKFKKVLVVAMAIAVVCAFTACGSSDSGSSSSSKDKKVTLHFANTLATSNAWNRAAKTLKSDLEKKSDGKLDLAIDAGGVNGTDKEQAEQCASGSIAICIGSTVGLDAYVTELGWINLPYVLHDMKTVEKEVFSDDGWMNKQMTKDIEKYNLKVAGYTSNDFRWLSNSKHPVKSAADIKGMKIRTPESKMYMNFFKNLGATPTSIPFTDLPSALQQKTVDGQDNGPQISVANDIPSFQKYWTKTNHAYAPAVVYVSQKVYDGLSDDQQKVLDECLQDYIANVKTLVAKDYKGFEKTMKDKGCQVIASTPTLDKQMKAAAEKVWQDKSVTKTFDQDAVNHILKDNGLK